MRICSSMRICSLREVTWIVLLACLWHGAPSHAQGVPTGDELNQLVAPIALYPDPLLAQICAASADPQQIIDADEWLKQNSSLQGQALTDAAAAQGFDPAFISLVNFPSVLGMMAAHVDDYAALGAAFKANQAAVMASIQAFRQQAYASGALDSNEYQTVSVERQNGVQVVVVKPADPQIVYVPQYQPAQVYVAGPPPGDVVAASLISFSAGIVIGALIADSRPWGWGAWGWGWGGRGVIYHNSPWGFHYVYRSPRPYYRPRPPIYGRPIYARPPPNWNHRPGYRPPPPGYRPPGPNRPPGHGGDRPGYGGGRPPGNGDHGRPPGEGGHGRPPGNGEWVRPPGNGDGRRPPGNGGGRPPGNGAVTRPVPMNRGGNHPGNGAVTRPTPTNSGGSRPPGNGSVTRPAPTNSRPAPTNPVGSRPARNPYAGYPQGGGRQQIQRPQPTPQSMGARPGGFSGNNNGGAARAASNRGQASTGQGRRQGGGPHK